MSIRSCCFVSAAMLMLSGWLVGEETPKETPQEAPQNRPAAEAPAEIKFTRLSRDEDGKLLSMDTAIARYVPADPQAAGIVVELIGAVHVGEKSYYESLNSQFEQYDALLFELVAPPNTKIPKGGGERSGNPISAIQNAMKSMLGLEFQLEQVDYTRPNFVHADMSPSEFSEKMKEKNESFWTLFLRMMGHGMAQQSNSQRTTDLSLLAALLSKNREIRLKQAMAEQLEDMEGAVEAIEGPDGSTILTERNKKALEVLKRELQGGKKKIGIFYGAAHLPDMHRRLENEFGLKMVDQRWLAAWNLKAPPPTKTSKRKSKEKSKEKALTTEGD